jgi:hypothetical protein
MVVIYPSLGDFGVYVKNIFFEWFSITMADRISINVIKISLKSR